MAEMMILIDMEKCTGCRICEMACSLNHKQVIAPNFSRIKVLKDESFGINVPMVCQQCSEPICSTVCPLDLYSREEETGAVVSREENCVGCKACLLACPYGVISIDTTKNAAIKCDLCNGEPLCVEFCPTNAIQYVRADEADRLLKRKMFNRVTKEMKEVRRIERSE